VEATQWSWRPPVPLAEQLHQRWDEQGSHDGRVDQDRECSAHAELLEEDQLRQGERSDRDAEEKRGGGDDSAGALEPYGDRLAARDPGVARLLDPGEEEHGVVSREAECNCEEEDRLGCLERARARVVE
jgi:hypothetical protein